MPALRAALRWLLDAWFPPTCAGCEREGFWMCKKCSQLFVLDSSCLQCRWPTRNSRFCLSCAGKWTLSGVIRIAPYHHHAIQSAIRAIKYDGAFVVVEPFGAALAPHIATLAAELSRPLLVPIPLADKRRAERGFNQAEILAASLHRATGIPLLSHALIRMRETQTQTELARTERKKNVTGAFDAPSPSLLRGHDIILVDDVATTGATLESAAITCRAAGAKTIYGCVIAHG